MTTLGSNSCSLILTAVYLCLAQTSHKHRISETSAIVSKQSILRSFLHSGNDLLLRSKRHKL